MDDTKSKNSSKSVLDVDPEAPQLVAGQGDGEDEVYSVFSKSAKRFIVFMVSVSALISPLAATLYLPALTPLAEQLNVSDSLINLTITSYMVSIIHCPS
jgi:hypothetical protein